MKAISDRTGSKSFLQVSEEENKELRDEDVANYRSSKLNKIDESYNPLANVSDNKSCFEYVMEQIGGVISDEKERFIASISYKFFTGKWLYRLRYRNCRQKN
ncbi:MAG UNVERIFIED_CONTAM: hypothetical protein LVQ98_06935 [Rickettsiaceae bacterium]